MNEEKINFETALAEWRRKHGIQDDDAVLQMLDLLKLFFQNVKVEIPADADSVSFFGFMIFGGGGKSIPRTESSSL